MSEIARSRNRLTAYIAGDLTSEPYRWYLVEIEKIVAAAGFRTFLPHRDATVHQRQQRERGLLNAADYQDDSLLQLAFSEDMVALFESDVGIFLLDGLSFGTSQELGVAFALRRLGRISAVFGIYTHVRGIRYLDVIRRFSCDIIVSDLTALRNTLESFVQQHSKLNRMSTPTGDPSAGLFELQESA